MVELVKIFPLGIAEFPCPSLSAMSISMHMQDELTISQAMERLQARGIDVARRTVASWVEQGLFTKRWVETPIGHYWVIPAREIESFKPPKAGRPPKAKTETVSKAGKKSGKK